MTNPLAQLPALGQSVWLDFVSRPLLEKGELRRLIAEDGIRGVTSNPSIFEKAIAHSTDYDADLAACVRAADRDVDALFEHLAIADIRMAADQLRPVHDQTKGVDGYVSLEVSPYLAMDTEGTIAEARRLWRAVERPNLMIKVPGTAPGVSAIRTLIGDGINVNVTLLFSVAAYEAVAEAYLAGLEAANAGRRDIARIASVASFFVSRIDAAVEREVAERLKTARGAEAEALRGLDGKVAIANAKRAYQRYQTLITSPRWKKLVAKGARPQRLLWASTGTKSKHLPDTLYVDELIGPETVNTMPPATMDAVRDHGHAKITLTHDVAGAEAVLATLARVHISLDAITEELVADGVRRFADDADKLFAAVARRRAEVLDGTAPRQTITPGPDAEIFAAESERWREEGLIRLLWRRDSALWTGADEDQWLGWLDAIAAGEAALPALGAFRADLAKAGFTDIVLLGMGGSSLGAEVLATTLKPAAKGPRFHMLDSTDPAQIAALEAAITLETTLFIVASKSGATLEPELMRRHFFARAGDAKQFVAITDPGSALEKIAKADGYRAIFPGEKTIGGRYSVLSHFGLVPAAALGLDVARLLTLARQMQHGSGASVPPDENPGVALGVFLGINARAGRDKVTLIASPGIKAIGAWLEQLLAESTGKHGHGLIPIANEPPVAPEEYSTDRVFAYLALDGAADPAQQRLVAALEAMGRPVARLRVPSPDHIGQEFFRWEIATAVAGNILGINPFDQPDVEASKIKTRALTEDFEKTGAFSETAPLLRDGAIALYADPANARALAGAKTLADALAAHFARAKPGDYAAILAYIARNPTHEAALEGLRRTILAAKKIATCLGFGPRFLHSTGQVYKGGPNSGIFLQITASDANDIAIPGQRATFGIVKAAQALGDLGVLVERHRRVLRLHIGGDLGSGLAALDTALMRALETKS